MSEPWIYCLTNIIKRGIGWVIISNEHTSTDILQLENDLTGLFKRRQVDYHIGAGQTDPRSYRLTASNLDDDIKLAVYSYLLHALESMNVDIDLSDPDIPKLSIQNSNTKGTSLQYQIVGVSAIASGPNKEVLAQKFHIDFKRGSGALLVLLAVGDGVFWNPELEGRIAVPRGALVLFLPTVSHRGAQYDNTLSSQYANLRVHMYIRHLHETSSPPGEIYEAS